MKTLFDVMPDDPCSVPLVFGEFMLPRPPLSCEPKTLRVLAFLALAMEPESPLPPPEVMLIPELEFG